MFKSGDEVYLNPKASFNLPKLQDYQENYPDAIWTVERYDDDYNGYTIYHPDAGRARGVSENKIIPANELNLIKIKSQEF